MAANVAANHPNPRSQRRRYAWPSPETTSASSAASQGRRRVRSAMAGRTTSRPEKLPLSRSVYVADAPNSGMFGVPLGEFLYGAAFAVFGVGTWGIGLGVAYLLYRRWRGDGPRDGDG